MGNSRENALPLAAQLPYCLKPALVSVGWTDQQITFKRRYSNGYLKRTLDEEDFNLTFYEPKRPSVTLFYTSYFPIAVIETCLPGETLETALERSSLHAPADEGGLDLQFVFSSDGYHFLELEIPTGKKRSLPAPAFPSPSNLWARYLVAKGISPGKGHKSMPKFNIHSPLRQVQFYEYLAIHKALEAVVSGKRRMALAVAVPSCLPFLGALMIASLWQERLAKRFLYLAESTDLDEPNLKTQFSIFRETVRDIHHLPPESEYAPFIVLQPASRERILGNPVFCQFPPQFFDVVIVHQFHRNTIANDENWQGILTYFHPAIHIGLSILDEPPFDSGERYCFGEFVYCYP
ncbi:MAG: hypothetical protein AAB316_16310, partial [Bacteroidota bacterium]